MADRPRQDEEETGMGRVSSASKGSVEFSILVSCYFEEKSINEFHRRLSSTLDELKRNFEIIYVNDGSTDGT